MVSLQSLESEFGFSSKHTGIMVAGNDAAALMLVSVVSFFGPKGSKPKWLGIGTIITGKLFQFKISLYLNFKA